MDTQKMYLFLITLTSLARLGQPVFGYAIVTEPSRTLGHLFSFTASTNHAVIFNIGILGLYSLWKGKSASNMLNVHVILMLGSYLFLRILKLILWESPTLSWDTEISGFIAADRSYYESQDNVTVKETDTFEQRVRLFDPPDELVALVVIPFVLFNLIILPSVLLFSGNRCVSIEMSSA